MSTNSFFGVGASNKIGKLLDEYNPKSIFLVTGQSSFECSGAREALSDNLKRWKTTTFSDFSVNPSHNDLLFGIDLIKGVQADLVIAVGGGSVIDMAKLISILPFQKNDPEQCIKTNTICSDGLPLIAMPTTSGSGSEMTHFAVVYVNGVKYSLSHSSIVPKHSIIDPGLTFNLNPNQKAISGMDALCQAIESYWAKSANEISRNYAKQAIEIILDNFVKAVCENDRFAMIEMSRASNLAGMAINISKTTAAHAISYGLTIFHGVPHGHAVCMLLPSFIEINSKSSTIGMKEFFNIFKVTCLEECLKKFERIRKSIGLAGLSSLRLTQEDVVNIVEHVNEDRLFNNPVKITKKMIGEIFYKAHTDK